MQAKKSLDKIEGYNYLVFKNNLNYMIILKY